jgi:negative regulator of replication initiation
VKVEEKQTILQKEMFQQSSNSVNRQFFIFKTLFSTQTKGDIIKLSRIKQDIFDLNTGMD